MSYIPPTSLMTKVFLALLWPVKACCFLVAWPIGYAYGWTRAAFIDGRKF